MMNKRHLRKYLSPTWKPNLQNGLLHTDKIEYIIHTTVRNIDHTRVLILYVYSTKRLLKGSITPDYTVFESRHAHLSYEQIENKKPRWRVCNFRDLLSGYYRNLSALSAFYARSDEFRTIRFCDSTQDNGFRSLLKLQDRIFEIDCAKRRKAKAKKRRERMKGIKSIPFSVLEWIQNETLPAHGFYSYVRHRKEQNVYCTHCKATSKMSGVRHAKQGICPNCGRTMTFHAIGRTGSVCDNFTAQYIDKAGDELVIRILKGCISYSQYDYTPTFRYWENARIFIGTDNGKMTKDPYYYSYSDHNYPWRNGYRPVINHWVYHFEADLCGHLHTKNLSKVLKDTPWQYSQVEKFYLCDSKPFELLPYLEAYLLHPMIEYLVKSRLYHLTADFVYHSHGGRDSCINTRGKNMREVLKVSPSYLPLLQECDISMSALSLMHKLIAGGYSCNSEFISWCQSNKLYDVTRLMIVLKYISMHKLMRYLTEQYDSLKNLVVPFNVHPYKELENILVMYADYLEFCDKLKYDMTNSFILFPAHLKEAHDNTSKLFDEQKARIWDESIMEAYPALMEQYQFSKSGLLICVPKSSDEIVAEGQTLHHCVNGYVEKVAKHKTTILFLRQKAKPNEPYYTIEVNNNKVQQIRGDHNCATTKKIDKFMSAWKKAKLLPALKAA